MDVIKELYPERAAKGIQAAKDLVGVQAKVVSARNELIATCWGISPAINDMVQPVHAALVSADKAISDAISAMIDFAMKEEG